VNPNAAMNFIRSFRAQAAVKNRDLTLISESLLQIIA
jgi:hypothetical protein